MTLDPKIVEQILPSEDELGATGLNIAEGPAGFEESTFSRVGAEWGLFWVELLGNNVQHLRTLEDYEDLHRALEVRAKKLEALEKERAAKDDDGEDG